VTATHSLFFTDVLSLFGDAPIASTKTAGECLSTGTEGQCATAAADQDTEIVEENIERHFNLFAFAKGASTPACTSRMEVRGRRNVFDGAMWSNEGFTASRFRAGSATSSMEPNDSRRRGPRGLFVFAKRKRSLRR